MTYTIFQSCFTRHNYSRTGPSGRVFMVFGLVEFKTVAQSSAFKSFSDVSEFCRLDLRIELVSGRDVTLKLVKGSGPVSILGNYVVESYADDAVDTEDESADEDFKPGDSTADLDASDASGMETEGDEVDGDEVKDITEDAKEVGEPTSKDRKAKE